MRQGGFIGIFFLIILAILLFAPLPYYQSTSLKSMSLSSCLPGQICSKDGWNFTKPLWETILSYFPNKEEKAQLSSKKTDSWQVYTNSRYGYEIKYPNFLVPKEYRDDNYLDFVSFEGNYKSYKPFTIEVSYLPLEKAVENFRSRVEGILKVSFVESRNSTYEGFPSRIIKYSPRNEKKGITTSHFFIYNENYTYIISTNSETLDQILSTFKLIK